LRAASRGCRDRPRRFARSIRSDVIACTIAKRSAELARLFPIAQNIDVPAGHRRGDHPVRLRSCFPKPETVSMLSQYRLKSTDGNDAIDILIRRLQESP
jgi:hypothetical protein